MRLSLKSVCLGALTCIFISAASAQPGGRFGAVIDKAAAGCLGADAPATAAASVKACAAALSNVTAIGSKLSSGAAGGPDSNHFLVRRAAIELRLSALQGEIEGKAHSEVCHWVTLAAQSAAGVVPEASGPEAEADYRPVLQAVSTAFAACAPEPDAFASDVPG